MNNTQKKLPKPSALVFDWDNTLVDTWPVIHHALTETFTRMGIEPWDLDTTKNRVAKSMRDHFPALFGDRWEEAGEIYTTTYKSNHLTALNPLPQALEMLELLAASPIYAAVVSNKQGPTLRLEAKHMGWDKYFSKLVGSNDAAADKPDPAPLLLALEGSGISPNPEVWFIGDTLTDVECALNANCTPIFYGDNILPEEVAAKVFFIDDHGHLGRLIGEHHSN